MKYIFLTTIILFSFAANAQNTSSKDTSYKLKALDNSTCLVWVDGDQNHFGISINPKVSGIQFLSIYLGCKCLRARSARKPTGLGRSGLMVTATTPPTLSGSYTLQLSNDTYLFTGLIDLG